MKKNLLKVLAASTALFSAQSSLGQATAASGKTEGVRMVFVNVAEIFSENGSKEFVDRMTTLQTELKQRFDRITADQQKLQRLATELQSKDKAKWSSDSAREAKTEEAMRLEKDIQIAAQGAESHRAREMEKIQRDVEQKLAEAARIVAERLHVDVIDISNNKLYTNPKLDVTKELLTELNKRYEADKKSGVAKKA